MTDYTDAELLALKKAYATGVLRVEYEGRSVTYDNAAGLLARIRELERDIGGVAKRPIAGFATFGRGY